MRNAPFPTALLAAALALWAAGGEAAPRDLEVDYSVSIRGFPVGRTKLRAHVDDRQYWITVSGSLSGLARLVTSVEANASASGTIADDRPLAQGYEHQWVEDGETETVQMHFSGRGVDQIDLNPPIKRPERYVPVTAEQKADALDLASAFLWPAGGNASPEACNRVLPLIDGKRRFDIAFAYSRMDSYAVRRGSHNYRAIVCSIRYEPVSGHRVDKKNDGFLAESGDMEVWLADAGDGLLLPIKVRLQSKIGPATLEATRFDTQ